MLIDAKPALVLWFWNSLAFIRTRYDLGLTQHLHCTLWMLKSLWLSSVAYYFTVPTFAHYPQILVGILCLLGRRSIYLLLILVCREMVNAKLIPVIVHFLGITFCHACCSLQDLVINKPLLLDDTLIILYFLFLTLYNVLQILLLGIKVCLM